MAEQYTPNVGELCHDGAMRDAVHFALAPVVAGHALEPGDHVTLIGGQAMLAPKGQSIGIVDPFLRETVWDGERFWLFLYPNTITGLRHVWTHPFFKAVPPAIATKE